MYELEFKLKGHLFLFFLVKITTCLDVYVLYPYECCCFCKGKEVYLQMCYVGVFGVFVELFLVEVCWYFDAIF